MSAPRSPLPIKPLRPVQTWSPELLLKAQDVRWLFLDVDGVLTDGGLYYTEAGETLKRFHVHDGQGLKMVQQAGIGCVVISGRDGAALRTRLSGLGVTRMHLGVSEKLPVAQAVLRETGCSWFQVAMMGDDWPDLPLLRRAAFACAPRDAHAQAKALADHVTERPAGQGAVRECCDILLTAQGAYRSMLAALGTDAPSGGAASLMDQR
jgi:3-deoxy-D-manno-octulosonate 8-phosphate phosphatase (KDO 8-P phosphatase)